MTLFHKDENDYAIFQVDNLALLHIFQTICVCEPAAFVDHEWMLVFDHGTAIMVTGIRVKLWIKYSDFRYAALEEEWEITMMATWLSVSVVNYVLILLMANPEKQCIILAAAVCFGWNRVLCSRKRGLLTFIVVISELLNKLVSDVICKLMIAVSVTSSYVSLTEIPCPCCTCTHLWSKKIVGPGSLDTTPILSSQQCVDIKCFMEG